MLPFLPAQTAIENFDVPRPVMLTGGELADIQNLQDSILRFGLLNPVVVAHGPKNRPLRVVDGVKRLAALRRLAFMGKLPRSLTRIPYLVADHSAPCSNPLAMLSNIEQFEQVSELATKGLSNASIAIVLYASESYIADIRAVEKLSPKLRNAFFGGHIDLAQACAFATLPNPDSQDALLSALGPFADAPAILEAIKAGDTVVSLGADEDDILILPSRSVRAAA